ncbi:unnamed protein product [Clonostachys byssicola]|uniref:DNA repair protein Rad26 n=1 Tax=Clonostachys byssicola TaxID=160290 RepID=A0A9N9XWL9_9HYPO|nr:unnamed protein product [Clonostachys byssicola]
MDLDDEFGDDILDDLNDSTLQELENNALLLTQTRRAPDQPLLTKPAAAPQHTTNDYAWDEDEDLDHSEVINDGGEPVGHRPITSSLQQWQHARRPAPPRPSPQWNNAIDPARRGGAGLPQRQAHPGVGGLSQQAGLGAGPLQRPQYPQPSPGINRPLQSSQFAKPSIPPPNRPISSQQGQPNGNAFAALQQRVRALESELNAARGEAAIIRAKANKADQEHYDEVARLRKVNEEHAARQARLVEEALAAEKLALAAEKSASTELEFLQQDMREANSRAKQKDVTSRGKQAGVATTPKKAVKTWGLADGFEDVEMVSPSKSQGRGRHTGSIAIDLGERTPTKAKRKRPMVDSPVMALDTHTEEALAAMDQGHAATPADPPMAQPKQDQNQIPQAPFEFLQLILDHAAFHDEPPTFDVLSRYTFPTDPSTTLATLIFRKLPTMGNRHQPMQLLVDFVQTITGLWRACVEDSFWEPIKYLVALVEFTLQLHTIDIAPLILPALLPCAQPSVFNLAELRHKLPEEQLAKSDEYLALAQNIDSTKILTLLYITALSSLTLEMPEASGFQPKIVDFWQHLNLDTVAVLLTPRQLPQDVILILDLLATSSLPDSIGPITPEREPPFVAAFVMERVSIKLVESTRSITISAEDKRKIRIAALRTLIAFARYPFGAMQLASHDNVIPRIVACLSGAIDDLYDQDMSSTLVSPDNDDDDLVEVSTSSTQLTRIISQCVMLLHALVTDQNTANVVNISQKLSTSHGGSQRYLIALGRLTFAEEDLVMESGIESEIVEAAHELLEMAVTPDEGELVSEAFGS